MRKTDWSSDITEWAHLELIHQLLQPIPDRHAFPHRTDARKRLLEQRDIQSSRFDRNSFACPGG